VNSTLEDAVNFFKIQPCTQLFIPTSLPVEPGATADNALMPRLIAPAPEAARRFGIDDVAIGDLEPRFDAAEVAATILDADEADEAEDETGAEGIEDEKDDTRFVRLKSRPEADKYGFGVPEAATGVLLEEEQTEAIAADCLSDCSLADEAAAWI
jgi:hypothetical protein